MPYLGNQLPNASSSLNAQTLVTERNTTHNCFAAPALPLPASIFLHASLHRLEDAAPEIQYFKPVAHGAAGQSLLLDTLQALAMACTFVASQQNQNYRLRSGWWFALSIRDCRLLCLMLLCWRPKAGSFVT